jgi:hypothetical protein
MSERNPRTPALGHQGAVEDKNLVQDRFFELLSMQGTPAKAQAALPDLEAVMNAIAAAFAYEKQLGPTASK